MISIRDIRTTAQNCCPFCRSTLSFADSIVRCGSCNTLHHAACWIENRNLCSVFYCNAAFVFRATHKQTAIPKNLLLLLALHTAFNVALHFFINAFAPLVYSLHVQDALIVGFIELFILTSGGILLSRLKATGFPLSNSPLFVFALIILCWNVAFAGSLIWYWTANGLPALFALIRL